MDLEKIWAKTEPFQSVRTHGIVTGILAQIIYREVLAPGNRELLGETMQLDEDEMVSLIGYWVSLHDIGKIEFMFQCKDEQTKAYLLQEGDQDGNFLTDSVRHEGTSVEALKRIWRQMGIQRGARNFYAGVIGLHHQGKAGDKVSRRFGRICSWNLRKKCGRFFAKESCFCQTAPRRRSTQSRRCCWEF